MPPELASEVKLEIGHVLFIDIVGYSKLLIHEQSEQLQKLREIVRATEPFRAAQAEGKLLRLPTGDGGALVFRTTPEAPVACALEVSKGLRDHPDLRVRLTHVPHVDGARRGDGGGHHPITERLEPTATHGPQSCAHLTCVRCRPRAAHDRVACARCLSTPRRCAGFCTAC